MFGVVDARGLDRDLDRVVEVLLRDAPDLRGHRRREERHVLVVRGVGEDRLDVVREAHLEHLVGLVEDEEAQLTQVERALLEVVHDPARRADDDVHAAAQRAELHAVGLPAVDGQHVHARQPSGIPLEGLAHLEGELSRGSEHERLRRLLLEVELAEDGQREGRRLAGAGLREADDVPPLEQRRDRRLLDRRRVLVAELLEALEDSLVEPQVGESPVVRGACSVSSVVPVLVSGRSCCRWC